MTYVVKVKCIQGLTRIPLAFFSLSSSDEFKQTQSFYKAFDG